MLLLFGEAIIITAFILLKGKIPDNILVLNIVVSSIVYGLFFLNYATSWIDLKDKSQKQIGAFGVRWYAIWFYAIFAIGVIVSGYFLSELTFIIQLILQAILLFFLLFGIWFSNHSADKVQEVYEQEIQNRSRIIEMKIGMQTLKDAINNTDGLPEYFTKRVDTLDENLRFISPADNDEAYDLENSFVGIINEIKYAISDFSMNEERIESNLKKLERICQNRKNIYSK